MNPIGLPICRQCRAYFKLLGKNKYALYVVVVIMLLCMCNQASRFVLVATNVQMANEIHFGERECRSLSKTQEIDVCKQDSTLCDEERTNAVCGWYYTGTGYEYQLLAGPLFNIIFSFTSVPVGLILEKNKSNRKNVIAISAVLWSFMVILGGLATQYWHIAVTRLAIAFFEAPFTAFAISLLSSYFNQELRALALSIFTAGLHFGFSLAFIMKIIVVDIGWRSTYVVAGLPGIALAFITYITVKEPSKQLAQGPTLPSRTTVKCVDQSLLPAPLFNPLFVTIILAAAARCAGGRTYSYNINNYIQHYYPGYPTELYLSWLPACMGIISSIVGGVWADRRAIGEHGYIGRITVLIIGLVSS
ncbi:putative galactarate/D-glucarate transporter GudP [Saccoglossus kowalevskii]|uniref:Uncharacterized protein LOC100376077 n=1 Tax=Saccoglossus kowalevskii TaxID=10224 RepID=A0ABM0GWC6_SACKO|nr:PREDICTED: uncharacterized protein LOC100376077 [Saccoglossus kowalevskii]